VVLIQIFYLHTVADSQDCCFVLQRNYVLNNLVEYCIDEMLLGVRDTKHKSNVFLFIKTCRVVVGTYNVHFESDSASHGFC
jgi:hypothetical protein